MPCVMEDREPFFVGEICMAAARVTLDLLQSKLAFVEGLPKEKERCWPGGASAD